MMPRLLAALLFASTAYAVGLLIAQDLEIRRHRDYFRIHDTHLKVSAQGREFEGAMRITKDPGEMAW